MAQNEHDTRHAENVLEKRENQMSKYDIRPLTQRQTARFADEWRIVQQHFVDNLRTAVAEADQLIDDAMKARGYPISDFEAQTADLSVDYPTVVAHYRAAHEIDLRQKKERADTEELRGAMQHYHTRTEVWGSRNRRARLRPLLPGVFPTAYARGEGSYYGATRPRCARSFGVYGNPIALDVADSAARAPAILPSGCAGSGVPPGRCVQASGENPSSAQ